MSDKIIFYGFLLKKMQLHSSDNVCSIKPLETIQIPTVFIYST